MYSVLIVFIIDFLNKKKFVFYFVHETPSTAPESYAIFQVLRQDTTVQSTDTF